MLARIVALAAVVACATAAAGARQAPPVATALRSRSADVVREADAGYGAGLSVAAGEHGGVTVIAWRERKVRVEAHVVIEAPTEADLDTLASVVAVDFDPSPTTVSVKTHGPHDAAWIKGFKKFPKTLVGMPVRVDYVIHVPEYTALSIGVADGPVVVEGVTGIIGLTCARGDVRLTNISGSAQITASGGNLTIETRDRTWRGGNLDASSSGDLRFVAPAKFAAAFDLTAGGGITRVREGAEEALGRELEERVNNGGVSVTLVAGGTLRLELTPE